ncbi:hypothetical protein B0H15DRAFT_898690 [Mycena belliarum]|uniref:Uncharacterized protein n=1 Tax=Mycena belliarum TaxID=1033014 RepID=A0AAD6XVJ7_9AGAR|nr:hypothetical protein B0H15DRAFT_898690 [Mycena belliae]
MARATRSSIHQDTHNTKLPDTKKRKRLSEDGHPQKLQRTDVAPFAATRPIDDDHARKILHVLTVIDSQGLLDRVYPLEQSSSSAASYSLRTLLNHAQEHTLATLKTAVKNLLPISVHPRAPTPAPAAQQQRFCDIALSLLEQASFHPVSLDVESILPQEPADDNTPKAVATSNKRYALMQHLPGGDFWTSANLPLSAAPETGTADLKDLPTGHADLVAIFPAPSATASTSTLPTLGDYHRAPAPSYEPPRPKAVAAKRRVTRGSFLDYGPWASFAPCWVQNGTEIGMHQMGEVYAQREQRYRERVEARKRAIELHQRAVDLEQSVFVDEKEAPVAPETTTEVRDQVDLDALQDVLSPEAIESLKSVLGSLELENAVQELLNRNRKALQRLGQLQVERLRAAGGRKSTVKEGDEEWDVAHGILDSLTLLASLRPRSSAHPAAPLVPPPPVLHTLMQTLPRAAVPGWHGTLAARAPALRDDATVKVRPGVAATAPASAPVPTPAPGTPAGQPYGYPAYYTTAASRATPGLQHRYNSRQVPPTQQQQQQAQAQYYAPAAYAGTNQLPYGGGYTPTAGWYGAYGAAAASAYTGVQGQGQPQTPAQGQSYGTFFAGGAGSGTSTPVAGKAVANTVLGKAAGVQWAVMQTPPVLPAHLRAGGGGTHYPST